MIVTLKPEAEFLEGNPVYISVDGVESKPQGQVRGLGPLSFRQHQNSYQAHLTLYQAGEYHLEISSLEATWKKTISVQPYEYIGFSHEFGVFTLIFIPFILGVIVWTKKLMKKSKSAT